MNAKVKAFLLFRYPGQGQFYGQVDNRCGDIRFFQFPDDTGQGQDVVILIDDLFRDEFLMALADFPVFSSL